MKLNILSFKILVFALILGACQNNAMTTENSDSDSELTQVTDPVEVGRSYYRPLVREEGYRVSRSRGITKRLNSTMNLESFERGLIQLSQSYFPVQTNYFEEGQFIPEDVIQSLLERKDGPSEMGLNPTDNGSTDENQRNPIILETILEQDYYLETEEGYALNGIVIGLGLNSVDYFQKEAYGPTFQSEIARETLLAEGKRMANEILKHIREVEELKNVQVVFGLFEQAPRDDIAGGVYFSKASTDLEEFSEWQGINHEKHILGLEGEGTAISNSFSIFKQEVEDFFPNLSGVTGVSEYIDDILIDLSITITTQFFGEAEVIAFTQYVEARALEFFPNNTNIEIKIDSINGTEAILYKNAEDESYETYILSKN